MKTLFFAAGVVGALVSMGSARAQTAPVTTMTEAHARSALINAGCGTLSTLSVDAKGIWHGICWKGGAPTAMAVDTRGAVMPDPGHTQISEAHARSALISSGCGTLSTLSADSRGIWHGICWKGGAPVAMAVDPQGTVMADPGHTQMSEAHARSALTSAGCSNISTLSMSSNGTWTGGCWKGGAPVTASVEPDGKVVTR